jgi:hypothetical protein
VVSEAKSPGRTTSFGGSAEMERAEKTRISKFTVSRGLRYISEENPRMLNEVKL